MTPAACPSDNELLEHVDRQLSGERSIAVEQHLDRCGTCRRLVAELLRSEVAGTQSQVSPTGRRASEPAPVSRADALPGELLRQALRADAPHRESIVARVIAVLALLSLVMIVARETFVAVPPSGRGPNVDEFLPRATAVQAGLLAYSLVIIFVLRRGWYHRTLPYVSTIVELSALFLMTWSVMYAIGPWTLERSPARPLIGAYVVFTAVRSDPRLCVLAGIVAAAWWSGLHMHALASVPAERGPEVAIAGMSWFGATFYLLAGVGGAVVARYLVGRAEHALRAAREQDMFGKYVLHEPLGRGGMGEVFRATYCPEGGFSKAVAVKRLRSEIAANPDRIAAFREEARLAAQLAHPNVVMVLDFGRFRGNYMVAMELVDGVSLSTMLRRTGALPPLAVAHLGAELAAGLEYVHARRDASGHRLGLVHRDVNPPNVLVSRIGEIKLADFGAAMTAFATDAGKRVFVGKVAYAAPEQLRAAPLDDRADIYALGLTLHEAITGRPVFARSHEHALNTPIRLPSEFCADLPAELDGLIVEMLHVDAAMRPSAGDVRARLHAIHDRAATAAKTAGLLGAAVERARSASSTPLPNEPTGSTARD